MNPISEFFLQNMIAVFFLYGLSFFVMGVALALASRQQSQLYPVIVLHLLAAFGILHGAHEWIQMFQLIAAQTSGRVPSPWEESGKLLILVLSFTMLLIFGVVLPATDQHLRQWRFGSVIALLGAWCALTVVAGMWQQADLIEMLAMADVLARYLIGIPATLLGAFALMALQRSLRGQGMTQFGRDLVWCAATLFFYGAVGQLFVQPTPISPWLNSDQFLRWFGVPVQLFRAGMAVVFTVYILRALRVLDIESRLRLETATQTQLVAQAHALEAERHARQEHEALNDEIQSQARELALLLDLSNWLAAPMALDEQFSQVMRQVVHNLPFFDAGMIVLVPHGGGAPVVKARTGFATTDLEAGVEAGVEVAMEVDMARFGPARQLADRCLATGKAICRHVDDVVIEFVLESALFGEECWQYPSPTQSIALPLISQNEAIGTLVLARSKPSQHVLTLAGLKLLAGIARQLGLSIENMRLYRQVQEREKLLVNLLSQVVGAQEAERQRIARDLHDATGQSLTAISLGLRGVENTLAARDPQLNEPLATIQQFATDAIGELRRIIADLRPSHLDDLGLVAALRWYIQELRQRHPQFAVELHIQGGTVRLPRDVETALFRIAQEAMTNILKHADASQVEVTLAVQPASLNLSIHDNGRGFELDQILQGQRLGWGILGIRERAKLLGAECRIDSAPGYGTQIEVCVSLPNLEVIQENGADASGAPQVISTGS